MKPSLVLGIMSGTSIDGVDFVRVSEAEIPVEETSLALSAERVRGELHKLFAGRDPSRGLAFLVQHRLLERWIPELSDLRDVTTRVHPHQHQVVALRQHLRVEFGGTLRRQQQPEPELRPG